MKPGTGEWIAKAEADFLSANREFRALQNPNYDATCFCADMGVRSGARRH
jgi:hypothetical protein